MDQARYWKKLFGIELFKFKFVALYWLNRLFRICLPKLRSQQAYWAQRGTVYMEEILASGYLEHERFFQDLLIQEIGSLGCGSCFEGGCGFGWNLRRIKEDMPQARVGGIDFSLTQLNNAKTYMRGFDIPVVQADNCAMPYRDDAFDIGFSVGVFMNIHPAKIEVALREMIRVSRRFIIHIEYDDTRTTAALRQKRAFKTNIVSHDYNKLYEGLGQKTVKLMTYKDFGDAYRAYSETIQGPVERWEGFEGPEKYVFIVIEKRRDR
jgi:ubiquinone/menaquinone biosynthesis C-methylase UbiE